MKKSEMSVNMPLTTWEEYENYKKKYIDLTKELAGCFDDTLQKAGASPVLQFSTGKALAVARNFLPYNQKDTEVEVLA